MAEGNNYNIIGKIGDYLSLYKANNLLKQHLKKITDLPSWEGGAMTALLGGAVVYSLTGYSIQGAYHGAELGVLLYIEANCISILGYIWKKNELPDLPIHLIKNQSTENNNNIFVERNEFLEGMIELKKGEIEMLNVKIEAGIKRIYDEIISHSSEERKKQIEERKKFWERDYDFHRKNLEKFINVGKIESDKEFNILYNYYYDRGLVHIGFLTKKAWLTDLGKSWLEKYKTKSRKKENLENNNNEMKKSETNL